MNYFTRPEARNGLKEFQNTNGTFGDFSPCNLTQVRSYVSNKSKKTVVVLREKKGEDKHQLMGEALSWLQEQNPQLDILVNSDGKRANVGEACTISEEVLVGASVDKGGVYLG